MIVSTLPPGASFFDDLADALLAAFPAQLAAGDLSGIRVLVPAMPMAAEFRAALVRAAQRCSGSPALLLPRFDTLRTWAQSLPLPAVAEPLPASRRLVLLQEALRARAWFDERALWGIAAEMAALFDELTAASIGLPDDAESLVTQLEQAYALRASAPLAFEARVVHELWRALAASGAIDATARYRLQLAELARMPAQPLWVLLDAPVEESLDAAERAFLARYAEGQVVRICHPSPRETAATPVLDVLDAAWPAQLDTPLIERAEALAQRLPESPLAGRLALVAAAGREHEAQSAVAQVAEWLLSGKKRIALIAQDRLTARRVRALLEREGVLVSDETGWLLSTSRAAAAVDALVEVVAGNAYHRDVLDLCKSPFLFADLDASVRADAVATIEAAIRTGSVASGLARLRRVLLELGTDSVAPSLAVLDRIEAARALLDSRPATLVRWIGRLIKALEALGALDALRADTAGQALLDLLEARQLELEGTDAVFALSAWRDWLNREFEGASFRDGSLVSPVVVTPLNAVCLRRFEAALMIGGDQRHLAPAATGAFFNQSVRRELGLRTLADSERELRRDLELLLATVPQVTVTWQSVQDGEANLLAREFLVLSALHAEAWKTPLERPPLPARPDAAADASTAPVPTGQAAPSVAPGLVPARVSVSAYGSLVACPYRFFARHVLRLGELDEVSEEMEKSDYGALVHRSLELFHGRHPRVSALAEADALAALQECVNAVFAPAIGENLLAIGWRQRWGQRLGAYLDWQRAREAAGWHWAQAETPVTRTLALDDGGSVELYGRIDRIDRRDDGAAALLDYKTQTAKAIRDRLDDDVQLPAYALLHGDAGEAAYVALDDETVAAVRSCDDRASLQASAAAQAARLTCSMTAMRAGTGLPAHGVDTVCRWCEAAGLCRKAYVA
ncbi:PD-(D/E)XK nuclease family protein [uncultured Propionivibrio sp.]|uniref:PD-(D/E)XK nuclease family protein n=1 Tax=uncultured Propionivibrio sp. TaxID=426737 RepID=UPI0029BFFE59|nr:PD-(D/E)XK nuclease family protein [uncultured Propionivibrio sp.]